MANIPIRDIPGAVQTAPSANALLPMDNGTAMEKTTVQAIVDSGAPVASKSEAEVGTDNTKRMTALRVKESIAAEVGITIASAEQGDKADSAVQPTITISAGTGLVGGGDLSANRSFALSSTALASLALADTAVQPARSITAGTGLAGGGDLSADRTISLSTATQASLALADTAVQPGAAELLPAGGSTGQILAKATNDDYDAEWVASEAATAVSYGPQTLNDAQKAQARANIGASNFSFRNKVSNPNFSVNQRRATSPMASMPLWTFFLDRWHASTAGTTVSWSTDGAGITTLTIATGGSIRQVIEKEQFIAESGTYYLTWEGTAQGRIDGGAWGTSGSVSASLSGSANVSIEFRDGTVGKVQLERDTITPFHCRPFGEELQHCKRFWQKSYPYLGSLGEVTYVGAIRFQAASNTMQPYGSCTRFEVEMRDTPVITIYSPSSVNTTGSLSNDTAGGASVGYSALSSLSTKGWASIALSSSTDGNQFSFHYVADAELF